MINMIMHEPRAAGARARARALRFAYSPTYRHPTFAYLLAYDYYIPLYLRYSRYSCSTGTRNFLVLYAAGSTKPTETNRSRR